MCLADLQVMIQRKQTWNVRTIARVVYCRRQLSASGRWWLAPACWRPCCSRRPCGRSLAQLWGLDLNAFDRLFWLDEKFRNTKETRTQLDHWFGRMCMIVWQERLYSWPEPVRARPPKPFGSWQPNPVKSGFL